MVFYYITIVTTPLWALNHLVYGSIINAQESNHVCPRE